MLTGCCLSYCEYTHCYFADDPGGHPVDNYILCAPYYIQYIAHGMVHIKHEHMLHERVVQRCDSAG